jgi:hypothetical protein
MTYPNTSPQNMIINSLSEIQSASRRLARTSRKLHAPLNGKVEEARRMLSDATAALEEVYTAIRKTEGKE